MNENFIADTEEVHINKVKRNKTEKNWREVGEKANMQR
jgi:hypothetical protein